MRLSEFIRNIQVTFAVFCLMQNCIESAVTQSEIHSIYRFGFFNHQVEEVDTFVMCTYIIMFTALHRNHYLFHFIINYMRGKYIHTRSVLIALHRGVDEFLFFFIGSVPSSIRLRLPTTLHIRRLSDGLAAPAHTHQSASPKRGASCPQIPTISTGRWTQQQTRRTR